MAAEMGNAPSIRIGAAFRVTPAAGGRRMTSSMTRRRKGMRFRMPRISISGPARAVTKRTPHSLLRRDRVTERGQAVT